MLVLASFNSAQCLEADKEAEGVETAAVFLPFVDIFREQTPAVAEGNN